MLSHDVAGIADKLGLGSQVGLLGRLQAACQVFGRVWASLRDAVARPALVGVILATIAKLKTDGAALFHVKHWNARHEMNICGLVGSFELQALNVLLGWADSSCTSCELGK